MKLKPTEKLQLKVNPQQKLYGIYQCKKSAAAVQTQGTINKNAPHGPSSPE